MVFEHFRWARWLSGAMPLAALLLFPACQDPADDDDASGDDDDTSGVTIDAEFDITVTVSEIIPTVAIVNWSVDLDDITDAWIEFGPDDDYGIDAPVDPGDGPDFETYLVGMKASSEPHLRVVVVTAEGTARSDDRSYETGALSNQLPSTSMEFSQADKAMGGFLVTSTMAAPQAAVILDADGDIVWWLIEETSNFQISRARISHDGESVLYWSVNVGGGPGQGAADQELVRVRLDGVELERISLPEGHHDFVERSDGTVAYIEHDYETVQNEEIAGDRIMERAPDGATTEVYSIWEDIEYSGGSGGPPGDEFCHANSLDYVEDRDEYFMGSLFFSGIFSVEADGNGLNWIVGGTYSDFETANGSTSLYEHQHQFHVLEDSILVFNNGSPQEMESSAVEWAFDEQTMEVEKIREYTPSPSVYSFSLGDVTRLPNGNTLVDVSTSGQIDEVDSNGDLVWRLSFGLGGACGYVTWMETPYVHP